MQKAKMTTLLLILTFFISDSVLLGTNSSPIAIAINTYLPFALCAFLIFKCFKLDLKLNGDVLVFVVIFAVTMLLSAIVNSGFGTMYSFLAMAVTLMLCYLICECYDFDSYIHAFEKCVFFIAVFSLIVYAISYISFDLIRLFPITYNTSNFPLHNLGLTVVPQSFHLQNFRNYGLFREPGVYQMYLAIALYIQLFVKDKIKPLRIVIYIVAIVTTLSTTGFVVMLFLLAAFMFKRINKEKSRLKSHYRIKVLMVLLICVIAFMIYFDMFNIGTRVFTKLLAENPDHSDIARKASVVSNILIWLKYPIFGAGEAAMPFLFTDTTLNIFNRHAVDNTNTFLYFFASYGTLSGILFVLGAYGFSCRIGKKKYNSFVFFILIALLYVGENLRSSMLPYIIAIYGAQYLLLKKRESVKANFYIGNGTVN